MCIILLSWAATLGLWFQFLCWLKSSLEDVCSFTTNGGFLFLLFFLCYLILVLLTCDQKTCTILYFLRINWDFICYPIFVKYLGTWKEIAINYINQIQWGFCFLFFFVSLLIYLLLVYGSHSWLREVFESVLSLLCFKYFILSFPAIFTFYLFWYYIVWCIKMNEMCIFIMNFIPQHYNAFPMNSTVSNIHTANPAFYLWLPYVSWAILLLSKSVPKCK